MKAIEKLLANMQETIGAVAPQVSVPTVQFGPLEGWRNDRGVGLLSLDRIIEDPDQPREEFDAEQLDGLATSVKAHGVLQPVLVRWRAEMERWMLVGGARRFRAAQAAGLQSIPAKKIEGEPSPVEILEQRIAEQLLRTDWRPLEESRAIRDIMASRSWNGRAASNALGLTEKRISRALALLRLPADLQARVDSGEIPPAAGVELATLSAEEARALADKGLTVAEVVVEVKKRRKPMHRRGPVEPQEQKPRSVTRFTMIGAVVSVELEYSAAPEAIVAALRGALLQAESLERGEAA